MSDDRQMDLHAMDYSVKAGRGTDGKILLTLRFWASTDWATADIAMDPLTAMDFFRQGLATVIAAHPEIDIGDLEGDVERGRRQIEGGGGA